MTDHFLFFWLATGAAQAQKIKNVGNCFSTYENKVKTACFQKWLQ